MSVLHLSTHPPADRRFDALSAHKSAVNMHRARTRIRTTSGFTLIELMVTLAVLAILLSIAAPSFAQLMASNRLSTRTNEFIGALNLARSEAVRRSASVALRANATTGVEYAAAGWQVFTDSDEDGTKPGAVTPDNGTVIRDNGVMAGATTIKRMTRSGSAGAYTYANATAADSLYLVFTARGATTTSDKLPAFYKVCDSGNTTVKGRIVQVNVVGKISLDSTSVTCP